MRKVYLTENGFTSRKRIINYAKLFKEDGTDDELKNKLLKKGIVDPSSFEKIIEWPDLNIEDKLFINRMAFLIFKKYRLKANYKHFYKKLTDLQRGDFTELCDIFFDLIDENSNGLITFDECKKIFK